MVASFESRRTTLTGPAIFLLSSQDLAKQLLPDLQKQGTTGLPYVDMKAMVAGEDEIY